MKNFTIPKSLLIALMVVFVAGAANAQVSLRFEPENSTVEMGGSQRVGVWLDEAMDVRTIELTVSYDTEFLASIGGGPGAAYDALPGSPQIFEGFDDSTPGQWTGYAVAIGASVYITGPGELYFWDIEGLVPGVANITTVSVALAGADGLAIADVTLDATTLEVLAPFDSPAFIPEPEFTPGTTNTVSWNDAGATEYQVQMADSPAFTSIVADTDWISATSYDFAGLTNGQTYYYRIRARSDAPVYEGEWMAGTVFSTQDDGPPSSQAEPLDIYQTNFTFPVPWTGSDAVSGLSKVELWVDGGSGYSLYETNTDPDSGTPFSYTAPIEGSYSFYTIAYDDVDNAEAAPEVADALTTVDVTAPSGDLLINVGATLTNDQAVTLTNSIIDATLMRFTNIENDFSAMESQWQTFGASLAWNLTAGDGEKTVYAEYIDVAGNIYRISADILLDMTPPADSFVINNGNLMTNSQAVMLTNAGSDAVEMRFTNTDGVWPGWATYAATMDWEIPAGEAEHTVFAQYRDEAGNVSDESAAITLDTIAPVASFFINGDDPLTNATSVVLNNTSTEAAMMQFSNDGATWSGWLTFTEAHDWVLADVEGAHTVFGEFRDEAGNITAITDEITLDSIDPVAGFVINDDAAATNLTAVTLTSTTVDAVSMQFSNDGITYSGWVPFAETYSWELVMADGDHTVYGQFQDLAGNVLDTEDEISLDTTAPLGVIVINNGASLTNDPDITLTNAITGATTMQFSNDGLTWSAVLPFSGTHAWSLPDVDGSHTVLGKFFDAAGNEYNAEDSITLDSSPPDGSFVINNDEAITNSQDVGLTNSVFGAVEMRFTNTEDYWDGVGSEWQSYAVAIAWTLEAGEGSHTVYGQYRDTAGNIIDAEDAIVLDTVGPPATFVVNNDDVYTNSTLVLLTNTSTEAEQMRFSNDGVTYSGWTAYLESYDWTLTDTEGERTVYGQFMDIAGNITQDDDTITLDTVEPVASFVINNDEAVTGDLAIVLTNTATDAAAMQFSNDGTTYSGWVDYSDTLPWILEAGEGDHTVYGQFRDLAGNVTDADDIITLDQAAPAGSFVINDNDAFTNDLNVVLTNSITGATEMQFSNDGISFANWVAYTATSDWVLTTVDGDKTVYGNFRDAVGNVFQSTDLITLDTAPPAALFVINGDDVTTGNPSVSLTNTSTEAVQMQFSNDGVTFSNWVGYDTYFAWDIPNVDGEHTVYGIFRDAAGNTTEASDMITLDTTAPDADFVINDDAVFTNSENVVLTNTVVGATEMQFRNETGAWTNWMPFSPTHNWILSAGDGEKTVGGIFRDSSGNTTEATDEIILDTTEPDGSFVVNNDEQFTNSVDVVLTNSMTGATEMQFRNADGQWSDWVGYSATFAWVLDDVEGLQTVNGQYRDNAGNSTFVSDQITLDRVVPTAAFVINDDDVFTGDPNVVLTNTSADAVQMQFSNDGITFFDLVPYAQTHDWVLGGGDGQHTVYGQFFDQAGNMTATTDEIVLDTTAPDVPVLAAEPLFTQGEANTLVWNDLGAEAYYVEMATDGSFGTVLANSDWISATEFAFSGLDHGQTYFYRVKARDDLGNETEWSGVESSTQDALAPVSSAGPLDTYQTNATFEIPWSGSDETSGLASVELFVDGGSGFVSAGITTEMATPVPFSYTASGEGIYSFYTVATDIAGLEEDAPGAGDAVTTVDFTAPVGTIAINDGADLTNDPNVELTLAVTDAVQMRFRNAGDSWSELEAYANTRAWILPSVDGLATVEAEFLDAAGNLLEANDGIEFDMTPPEGTLAINGDAPVTNDPVVVLDNGITGATQMRFSNDGSSWPSWLDYADTHVWTLTPGDGLKTVYGQYRDLAGNVLALNDQITVDTTAPEMPVMVAEPAFTQGESNIVAWSNIGADSYYAEMADDELFTNVLTQSDWIPGTEFTFAGLSDGQRYYFRVKARDALFNETGWSGAVYSTQDAGAPVSAAGPLDAYQTNLTVSVPWTGSDATSGLASVELFVNDGGGWISAGVTTDVGTPEPFTFTAPIEGTYSFYTLATDVVGLIEAVPAEGDATTTVDVTFPAGALAINAGDEMTNTVAVVLTSTVTDDLGVTSMRFTNVDGDWPEWVPYALSFDWTLTGGDGLKTVFAQYQDPAGNVLAVHDQITLDTTPPGLPAFIAEPAFTAGLSNTLEWGDSGATSYFLQSALEEGFDTIVTNSGWVSNLNHTFIELDDGQIYYYRIRGRDAQENETAWASPTFSTQDATAPVSQVGVLPALQGATEITVPWTGEDSVSGLLQVELMVDDGTGWVSAGVTTEISTPTDFVFTVPAGGTYQFYTIATDVVGNVELAPSEADATTVVDFSAPAMATSLDASPGDHAITVNWTNPEDEDLALVEIWSAIWATDEGLSAYPEYDDIAAEPLRPSSRAAALASAEWHLVGSVDPTATMFLHNEGLEERGVYYYEVFAQDMAGNFGAPASQGTRAINYLLGDQNDDYEINVMDITSLGVTYGSFEGDAAYNNEVDVGPTDDHSRTGIPQTDNRIDFEDLTIMAMNYGLNKSAMEVSGSETPYLTWYQVDEYSWTLALVEPCATLKALHLVHSLPEGVSVTVEAGSALTESLPYFLANIDGHGLDAGFAVLGQNAVLPVDGEILRVTTSDPVDFSGVSIQTRDADNQKLGFDLSSEPLQVLPTAYRLANNYPNPFNPQTTIAFDLPQPQNVRLVIYDLKGRLVKELISESMAAGAHSIIWNGTNRSDARVASGVYFYQIQAGPMSDTKRMLLVK